MSVYAVTIVVGLLAALTLLQLALAAGAPLGHLAWGGQHRVLPSRLRIGSVVAVAIYAVTAWLSLERVGAISVLPLIVAEIGIWIVTAQLFLGIPLNLLSRSEAERWTMTPIVLILALAMLALALRL